MASTPMNNAWILGDVPYLQYLYLSCGMPLHGARAAVVFDVHMHATGRRPPPGLRKPRR